MNNFNPRAPYGTRQPRNHDRIHRQPISIHAPRTGRDSWMSPCRPPAPKFQSTRPVRDATGSLLPQGKVGLISIHAPRTGRDIDKAKAKRAERKISIHAPRTGRDLDVALPPASAQISIHAPRTGRDSGSEERWPFYGISIHAPRTGRDLLPPADPPRRHRISIHAPRTGRD